MSIRSRSIVGLSWVLAIAVGAGCGWLQNGNQTDEQKRADAEKTRDDVAKATERAKPELEKAGQELKEAAKTAAEQAHAGGAGRERGLGAGKQGGLEFRDGKRTRGAAGSHPA